MRFYFLMLLRAYTFLGLIGLVSMSQSAQAQESYDHSFVHEVSVGYQVGGSGNTYFFTYNSALQMALSTGKNIAENVLLAGRVGIENNKEGTIYPLAIQLKKSFGKNAKQFLQLHTGYSHGSSSNTNTNYKYRGGALAGLSYGLDLAKIGGNKIFASLGYHLRRSKVIYKPFDSSAQVITPIDNHFLGLDMGFQF